MKKGSATFSYPGAMTPAGFHSYYREGLSGCTHIYILKGGPGCGKSTLMRKIGLLLQEQGQDVEYWPCSSDDASLDGVICRSLGLAVVDGTAPHTLDPLYPGAVESLVNMGCWDEAQLRPHLAQMQRLSEEGSSHYAKARQHLATARQISQTEAEANREALDTQRLSALCRSLTADIFCRSESVRRFFISVVTPGGEQHIAEELTEGMQRILLKGPRGCGQTELLQTIAQAAQLNGQSCAFGYRAILPQEPAMLLLNEQKLAIVPAELVQVREDDRIIDCAALLTGAPTPSRNAAVQKALDAAAAEIGAAHALHDELEDIYRPAIDFAAVTRIGDELLTKIQQLIAAQA